MVTTNCATVKITKSGYQESDASVPPSPDVYQQLVELAEDTKEIAQSVREDADAGEFDGEEGYSPKVSLTEELDLSLIHISSIDIERLDKPYQKAVSGLNENLQEGLGLGSFVLKPLGADKAEFVTADKFVPISFDDNGKPTDIAFFTVKRVGENDYFTSCLLYTSRSMQ